jgi:hypothetical protein
MFLLLSASWPLVGESTSLVELTEVSGAVAAAVCPTDGPEGIRSKRQREPRDPT